MFTRLHNYGKLKNRKFEIQKRIIMAKFLGKDYYNIEMDILRKNYEEWKTLRKNSKAPFFIVYSDFKTKLKEVSGGALKLYIFLGFHVNTYTGECWVSSETIAEFFGNDERTVKKWFSELETLGLITRMQTGFHRIANTFLLPYGTDEKNEITPNEQ